MADPDRLATLVPTLAGVSVVCWLMGAPRPRAELHGPRLRTLLERLVDTPVRGLVYEAAGSVAAGLLADGAAVVREAAARVAHPGGGRRRPTPADPSGWRR